MADGIDPSPHDRLAAALADRYRLERELGQGGMATVYQAHDLRHERKVAVKVMRPELAAVIGGERFLVEIRTTANLQHPHILPLFDSGQVDGTVFYVMPYVEGESLRDRLAREKQLPIADALRIAGEIAGALDYAHRHGVIHRDIKPENVLLHDGQALVADFGIALAVTTAGGTRMTETGLSLGTPHYMSPEQAMGERTVDPRTDVYALGCVLYEMLTGEPPFTGPTAQSIVAKVMSEKPAPLIPRRDTVPAEVEDAVLTALAKLPADRFASAAEFAAAISPSSARTVARRSGRADSGAALRRAPRRALALAALAGAGTAALLAGAIRWVAGRRGSTPVEAARAQHTFTGMAVLPALSPDGAFLAYVQRDCRHEIDSACRDGLFVQEIGTNRPIALLSDVPHLNGVRWTHDGGSVVLAGDLGASGNGLFVLPRLGGTPRRIADAGPFDTHPSADSVIVASAGNPTILRTVSTETGAIGDSLPLAGVQDVLSLAWAPDGHRIALGSSRDAFWLADLRRRAVIDSMPNSFTRGPIRWTSSGDALLVFEGQRAREDHLLRVPAGRRLGRPTILLPRVPTLYRGWLDVARRTGRIAIATGDAIQDLWAFEVGTGRATGRQVLQGTTWYGGPALSADGADAYYLRGDAVGDNLYHYRLKDGTEEALTAEHQAGANLTTLSPDGRKVAYGAFSEGARRTEFAVLELASRRLSRRLVPTGDWLLLADGHVVGNTSDGWVMGDSVAAPFVPLPDSLHLIRAAAAPSGARFAAVRARGDSAVLSVIGLAPLTVATLATLDPEDVGDGISWPAGDDIYLARWRAADSLPGIWRIPSKGGTPTLVATLPVRCARRQTAVADGGRKAICLVQQYRSDIWTVDSLGR